jgi:putative ABC transport system substrate-binding protein
VVGYLSAGVAANSITARWFRQGLTEEGFVEGRNVVIETRNAEGQLDRLQAMAADLSRRQVSAIVAFGIPGVTAARAATTTIPIVFSGGFDPVAAGFVASLNRPGGNLTGITSLALELGPKRLELLHELVPEAASIALLANPANSISAETQSMDLRTAARTLGLPPPHMLYASSEHDFQAVFAALMRLRAGGLVITNDSLFNSRTEQLGTLALRHALPTVFQFREFAAAGGLASYNSNLQDVSRLIGVYTGRILKGEKPADLPVQRATKVELIINLKTAKALGLTVPLSLRGRADEVIE